MKKVLLVADISNLYYCIRGVYGNKQRLDYSRFVKESLEKGEVLYKAIAYGAEMNHEADSFKNTLTHLGFTLKYKKPKCFGTKERKADWDVGIAIDIVSLLNHVDVVVLGSADGDMAPCINYIKNHGKECRVHACRISYELKEIATNYREIDQSFIIS